MGGETGGLADIMGGETGGLADVRGGATGGWRDVTGGQQMSGAELAHPYRQRTCLLLSCCLPQQLPCPALLHGRCGHRRAVGHPRRSHRRPVRPDGCVHLPGCSASAAAPRHMHACCPQSKPASGPTATTLVRSSPAGGATGGLSDIRGGHTGGLADIQGGETGGLRDIGPDRRT